MLVVEDEPVQAGLLERSLGDAGFEVACLGRGGDVEDWVRAHAPDAILLDVMLPEVDGFELCRRIRAFSTVPLIMTTARAAEVDRLRGLEIGADDYVCKPLSVREVIARLRALLRRAVQWRDLPAPGGIHIDAEAMQARWQGSVLALTPVEFRLLAALVARPGRVLSRLQLLDAIHDDGRETSDRTVDSHIKNLRRKLAEVAPDSDPIESVYGIGYRFV